MGILRDTVGVTSELLIFHDPYDEYCPPEVIGEFINSTGHVVQQFILAHSAADSTRHLHGYTIQGNRSWVSTHLIHIKRGLYDVHIENWDDGSGEGMTRSIEYDQYGWMEANEHSYQEPSNRDKNTWVNNHDRTEEYLNGYEHIDWMIYSDQGGYW